MHLLLGIMLEFCGEFSFQELGKGVSRAAAGGSAKPIRQRFDDISGYREIRLIRAASYVDGRSTYIPDEADSRLLPHCLGPLQLLAPMVYSLLATYPPPGAPSLPPSKSGPLIGFITNWEKSNLAKS